ncbi:MAG: hypothetical protein H6669_13615 [Ardenticatenaceae bacterium]|nr:hypothetical protein [Ardenticatenaceae bacterium]
MENAARRGVRIRILEATGFGGRIRDCRIDAVDVAVSDQVERCGRLICGPGLAAATMHHKSWIVDGRSLYLGSANMDWRSLTQVKELGVIVENQPVVAADAVLQLKPGGSLQQWNRGRPKSWTRWHKSRASCLIGRCWQRETSRTRLPPPNTTRLIPCR